MIRDVEVFAVWDGQKDELRDWQRDASKLAASAGRIGYLRDWHVGPLCPSSHLVTEAFRIATRIPATTLRARLPQTRLAAEIQFRRFNGVAEESAIGGFCDEYDEFVWFCEAVERKTGRPPLVVVRFP